MEGMEWRGSVHRIRNCVLDLLSMEEDLMEEDEETWVLTEASLRLKSTFLYCDLSQLISNARDESKTLLADLANELFYHMDQLDNAVKRRSNSVAQIRYNEVANVLQELLAVLMAPL